MRPVLSGFVCSTMLISVRASSVYGLAICSTGFRSALGIGGHGAILCPVRGASLISMAVPRQINFLSFALACIAMVACHYADRLGASAAEAALAPNGPLRSPR